MKNTIYLLVIIVGLVAVAAKLNWIEIPWLSERIVKAPEAEQPPTGGDPPKPEPVEPVPADEPKPEVAEAKPPKAELDTQPAPEVTEAKPAPEPQPEPAPAGPVPPDEVVADLHGKYEAALASQAQEPFEAASAKLTASYLAALEREEQAAQAAADLDAVLHWRNERLRLEGQGAAGEARGGPPAKLVEMRKIYEVETAKLAEARETKEAELRAKYDEALAGHVKQLTQSRKIEEALAVEEWREPYRVREEKAEEPEMVAGIGGGAAGAGVVPAAGAAGAPGNRLTLAEIDRGEVGSELEIILPGGIPMVFCWCPPGKFLMGSPLDEEGREGLYIGRKSDETQRLVELTKGFWLGKYEVTQAQWTALMETTVQEQHALIPNRDAERWLRLTGIGPDQPMYFVNWEESVSFCKKLGRAFRTPGRWEFVLPTEAQWEYACRAGTTGPYGGTGVVDEMGWHVGNSGGTTHPVGQKKPNAWGLHDMHGNVSEWCADYWCAEHPREAVVDPEGPRQGSNRVRRGGCWYRDARYCRSADRGRDNPVIQYSRLGFRVAVSSTR